MPAFVDGLRYEKQRFSGLVERGGRYAGIEFEDCSFERCLLAECSFYRCRFSHCRFKGCDLSVLKVPNSRFVETSFDGCKLIGVDWTVAGDRTESKLPLSIGFTDCVLNLSSFFGLGLKGAKLLRCTAHDVDFADADLSEADCRGSDFEQSKFLHTNLTKADFREAAGYAINPAANTVKQAKFSLPEAISLLAGFDVVVE